VNPQQPVISLDKHRAIGSARLLPAVDIIQFDQLLQLLDEALPLPFRDRRERALLRALHRRFIVLNTLRPAAVIRRCADPKDPRSGRAKPCNLVVEKSLKCTWMAGGVTVAIEGGGKREQG
jgi:hypothetical protein